MGVAMQDPVMVVSSGRCGSTLLSQMLRRHDEVLSVSEYFFCVRPFGFPAEPIDGERFWNLLSLPRPSHAVALKHGLIPEEVLYPFGPKARFRADEGLPPIALVTLPFLTDDPDGLFDEVHALVRNWPEAPVSEQHLRLLDWLCSRFGRRIWVERSGGSLRDVPSFLEHFPNARFIHLYRDGRETAMSMSRHHSFRFVIFGLQMEAALGFHPFMTAERPDGFTPPDEWRGLLPETFDVETYRSRAIPIEAFGGLWNAMIQGGMDLLDPLPEDRVLSMRYESLLDDPATELRRLLAFLGHDLEDDKWIAEAASLSRRKPSTWTSLSEEERIRLDEACAEGLERLGYSRGESGMRDASSAVTTPRSVSTAG